MAIFNSFLLGQVSQSVGNVTMCQLNGESVARGKIKFRKDNPTTEMLNRRAKFRVLGSWAKRLMPIIRKGFAGEGMNTALNMFMKTNLGAVDVAEDHVATVDFGRLKLSSGMLTPPSMTVTLDAGETQFSAVAATQTVTSGFTEEDDRLWLAFVETELRQAPMLQVGTRGSGGTTSLPMPEDWTAANVKAYCFATSADGKEMSDSKLLTITPQA